MTGVQYPGQITVTRAYPDEGHGVMTVTVVPPTTPTLTFPPVREGR
jgi:hypothetical protein